jgi:hypothetical protein
MAGKWQLDSINSAAERESGLPQVQLTSPGDAGAAFFPSQSPKTPLYTPNYFGKLALNNSLLSGQSPQCSIDVNGEPAPAARLPATRFLQAERWGSVAGEPGGLLAGTAVATPDGMVAADSIAIGDLVLTLAGSAWPVKWVGLQRQSAAVLAANPQLYPIRVRQGALGGGVPHRELVMAPGQILHVDGVLVACAALVNGVTILQDRTPGDRIYYQIELERHDLILTEGAALGSYLDDGSRAQLQNAADYDTLYARGVRLPARYCAPLLPEGATLEALRHRLASLATDTGVAAPVGALRGSLDEVSRARIIGWARDEADPDRPVRLLVLDDGVVIGRVVANRHRPDLAQAGLGSGRHGFELALPGGLSPLIRHVISVQREDDGQDLPHSPWVQEIAVAAPVMVLSPGGLTGEHYRGNLDAVSRTQICGWVQDKAVPDRPIGLQILDNGAEIARVLANIYRPDLEQAGFGTGWHGFDVSLPAGLSPVIRHVIQVKCEADGSELPGSPFVLEPADSFDLALEAAVAQAVTSLDSTAAQGRALSFLVAQTDRLLQRRADADGQRAVRKLQQQFQRRWTPAGPALHEPGLRALVIDARAPVATRDAGSQAVLSHMRALQRLGYVVSFVAADEMIPPDPTAADLAGRAITVCGGPFYASVEDVLRRQAGCFDLVYLHRGAIAARYLALARNFQPEARIVYSVADLHHARMERQAAVEQRPDLQAGVTRMRVAECSAAWSADAVITHSTVEMALLREDVPDVAIHHVPWDVPVRQTQIPFAARSGVAFIGHYGHPPNADAARWLVESVMPLVWAVNPAITCSLVGSAMPPSVQELARPGVVALGHVADLGADVFDQVRLTVAPLRYGAGVKGKVLESFAAGVPCVMSEVAAEGIDLPAALRNLVGRDAAGLAALMCRMHANRTANAVAAKAGVEMISTGFSAALVTAALGGAVGARMRG